MGTTDNTAVQTATQNLQNKSLANAAASSGLSGSVGMGARNVPEDMMKVSSALTANGLMEAPQSHADNTLYKGIIGAQERMDSSLKRDGLVNPGGPTEQTFARLAGQGFVKPAPAHPATPAAPAQPATGDTVLNAELRADKKQNAVAAAQARVKANLSDDNRSDFRKAQDRDRLEKAREDAERAEGRARHEAAERRRRNLEQQAEAQRKATADAEKQAVHAGKAVNAGLTKLVNQAGKAIDNAVRHAQQNADLPSRHPRVREAGLGQSANPGLSSVDVESRARGNDKLVAGSNAITLSDDAIASNRRTADALGKVRGVGDLSRFTADAINTGGDKAVYEVADLIGQVRARDPEQAKELIDKTIRGIGADHRTRLEALFDGRGVEDLHIDGHLRRPETPLGAKWRTMELKPEDRLDPDNARRDMLYRPEDDEYAVQLRDAEAGAGAHPAEDDGTGRSSSNVETARNGGAGNDQLEVPGLSHRDLATPSSHADQIEGLDEQAQKAVDGLKALGEANAAIGAGKRLSDVDADRLKSRMDEAFRFDEDAQLKARAMADALRSGNLDDIETLQRDLGKLADNPERRKAQDETREYYRRTTPEQRQRHAEQRGVHRARMEDGMTALTSAAAQLDREYRTRDENAALARDGNTVARKVLAASEERIGKLEATIRETAKSVEKDAVAYQGIPTHPHPDIDKRGARQHDAMETAGETRKSVLKTGAAVALAVAAPYASKGAGLAGRAGLAAVGAVPSAGLAFSTELRRSSKHAFDESGIDASDRKSVEGFGKDHADKARDAVGRAFQAGFADLAGNLSGHLSAEKFGELVGFASGYITDAAFRPKPN